MTFGGVTFELLKSIRKKKKLLAGTQSDKFKRGEINKGRSLSFECNGMSWIPMKTTEFSKLSHLHCLIINILSPKLT